MKLLVCLLLLALNAGYHVVESRSLRESRTIRHLYVFGDSFGDNGNIVNGGKTKMTRQWYFPYGNNFVLGDGSTQSTPTGRFSNFLVQSDLIARNILGLDQAPTPYWPCFSRDRNCGQDDHDGMTFAVGGAGVFEVPGQKVATLVDQVDAFESLIVDGTITEKRLRHSMALVAVSGNDYARVGVAGVSSFSDIPAFINNVTMGIVASVQRLQEMGVRKVLVNNLPPIGCSPSQTMPNQFTRCDGGGNFFASVHNDNLKHLLRAMDDVHIVDLNTAFTKIVNPGSGDDGYGVFEERLRPCCESLDAEGYCGLMGQTDADFRYTLCEDPSKNFYWDDMHPTQAGWEAVMKQLQGAIEDFCLD